MHLDQNRDKANKGHTPKIPQITKQTKRFLPLKTFKYLLANDTEHLFRRYVLKRPLRYGIAYLLSALKKNRCKSSGDFFFYGIPDEQAFVKLVCSSEALLIVGFSFCQKPLNCPDQRFSPTCRADPTHPICRDCLIGKVKSTVPVTIIPTIYAIGKTFFELKEKHPQKKLCFLITACRLSLEMFAPFGHMIGAKGIGICLSGRICNTFRAFELAEQGIKPGLTFLSPETETRLLNLLNSTLQLF